MKKKLKILLWILLYLFYLLCTIIFLLIVINIIKGKELTVDLRIAISIYIITCFFIALSFIINVNWKSISKHNRMQFVGLYSVVNWLMLAIYYFLYITNFKNDVIFLCWTTLIFGILFITIKFGFIFYSIFNKNKIEIKYAAWKIKNKTKECDAMQIIFDEEIKHNDSNNLISKKYTSYSYINSVMQSFLLVIFLFKCSKKYLQFDEINNDFKNILKTIKKEKLINVNKEFYNVIRTITSIEFYADWVAKSNKYELKKLFKKRYLVPIVSTILSIAMTLLNPKDGPTIVSLVIIIASTIVGYIKINEFAEMKPNKTSLDEYLIEFDDAISNFYWGNYSHFTIDNESKKCIIMLNNEKINFDINFIYHLDYEQFQLVFNFFNHFFEQSTIGINTNIITFHNSFNNLKVNISCKQQNILELYNKLNDEQM